MPQLTIQGTVHPAIYPLTVEYQPLLTTTEAGGEPPYELRVEISEGQITAIITLVEDVELSPADVSVRVLEACQGVANAAGLISGIPFRVELTSFRVNGETDTPLVLGDRRLSELLTGANRDVSSLSQYILTSNEAAQIASDAISMLERLSYAPIAGGRIADSIAREVHGGDGKEAWATMRNHLAVDRGYVQLLSDQSKGPRHGHRLYVPGETTAMIAERSWTLVDRYFHWLRGGRVPLDRHFFPELEGSG